MKKIIIFQGIAGLILVFGQMTSGAGSSARTVAFIPIIQPGDKTAEAATLHKEIAGAMAKASRNMITIVDETKMAPYASISVDESRDPSFMQSIMKKTGAGWIVHGLLFRDKNQYGAALFLSDASASTRVYLSYEKIDGYPALVSAIMNDLPDFLLKISEGDRFFLHENRKLRMVTEFSDLGFTGQAISFNAPYALQITGDGFICAATTTAARFRADGKIQQYYGKWGESRGEYACAYRIADDGKGNTVILDTTGKIIVYDKAGAHEIRSGQLTQIALSKSGNIIAVDAGGRRVRAYTLQGEIIAEHRTNDETPMAISKGAKGIIGLAIRDQRYVVQSLDDTGRLLSTRPLKIRNDGGYFVSINEDSAGNVYLLDMSGKKIVSCAPDGSVRWVTDQFPIYPDTLIGSAGDIAVSADGKTIFLADTTSRRIIKMKEFDAFPEYRTGDEYVAEAEKIAASDPDRALALMNQALIVDRKSRKALRALGRFHEKEKRFDRAQIYYAALTAVDPSDSDAKKSAARVEAAREAVRADLFAVRAKSDRDRLGPESAKAMYDEAVKGYERSLKLDPSQNEVRLRFDALKEMFGTAKTDLPPLVIESLKCDELFAAMYKFYADNPIGTITIENSTGKPIDRLTVETEVKNYMDYPTESRPVRSIQPGEKIRVQLFALFNNRILSLTEDSPLAVKLRIRYSVGGKEYEAGAAGNITVYNRNALTWDTTEKLASFITSRDSAVKTCARGTVQIFRNSRYPFMTQNLQSAIEIFDALGAYGMAYVPDPRTPFASYSKLRDKVDYVQYPRDTLRFKTGDCDDLTSLYCALLENIGIETAFITVPGHILMMLNTGVPAANRLQVSSKTELLVEYQGTIWVPVETTMLGKPFVDAWNAGSSTIDKNKKSGSVVFVAVKKAWERYAPVTLDDSSWEPALPQRDAIDRLFSADINTLIERELMPRVKDLNVSFNKSRSAQDANLIGIAYARFGRYPEAEVWFKKALDINPKYHQSATNLGNVYLLTSRQDDAKRMYDTAMGIKKDDARLHLNLAIFYRKKGDVPGATKEYRAAIAIDPDIAKGYAWLDSKSDASRSSMEDDSPLWVER